MQVNISWHDVNCDDPVPFNTFVLVTGPSGYIAGPYFICLAKARIVRDGRKFVWIGVAGDDLADNGWKPTYWAYVEFLLPGTY